MEISETERAALMTWLKDLREDARDKSIEILTDDQWEELTKISAAEFVQVASDIAIA